MGIETSQLVQPELAMLKKVLQFLLPAVGTGLGSSRLLSLLSLEWANAEMNLGLDFETIWTAELTRSNIILLFVDCFASYDGPLGTEVDLAALEDLIILGVRHVETLGQEMAGRARLHRIINVVLDSGRSLDWLIVHEGIIASLLACGPSDKLLERCQQRIQDTQDVHEIQSDKV